MKQSWWVPLQLCKEINSITSLNPLAEDTVPKLSQGGQLWRSCLSSCCWYSVSLILFLMLLCLCCSRCAELLLLLTTPPLCFSEPEVVCSVLSEPGSCRLPLISCRIMLCISVCFSPALSHQVEPSFQHKQANASGDMHSCSSNMQKYLTCNHSSNKV